MIVGVGIDVVDIDRFAATLDRTPNLRARLFTETERELPIASLAARFAAKEALAKALGAPVGMLWTDCAVERPTASQPTFVLRGTVQARFEELGGRTIHLSLSHDAGIASAMVVVEA